MLFNSMAFAVFLPIVFIVYWALPHRFRWMILLIASYYFYMSWNVKYVVLILFTTVISYITARLIETNPSKTKKKICLISTLISCLGVLFFFKYFNFFSNEIIEALNLLSLQLHPVTLTVLLPVGISFYTFQTLSYVIDVYKGEVKAEHHFGKYAVFISFFPQLVAGPIERTGNLLPQIHKKQIFDYEQAAYGLKLMAWGFFKKLAIADVLAEYVDLIYNSPENYYGFSLILATLFFSIQIYCDFSGYSDIAIGTAKLMGIDLMTNFKSPYFSSSVKEFWNRWHISLSSWFRDYVYIPLGGNRVGPVRHNINLMITFLVSGLWHGANWTFLVWGGVHGAASVAENIIDKQSRKRKAGSKLKWLKLIAVFIFCSFAWIFFRSENINEAIYIINNSLTGITDPLDYIMTGIADLGISKMKLSACIATISILLIYDYSSLKTDVIEAIGRRSIFIRWPAYYGILLWIFIMLPDAGNQFVYFQF